MFELLSNMYRGEEWSSNNIIKASSKEIFEKAIKLQYIEKNGRCNQWGDEIYVITEKGKKECKK